MATNDLMLSPTELETDICECPDDVPSYRDLIEGPDVYGTFCAECDLPVDKKTLNLLEQAKENK